MRSPWTYRAMYRNACLMNHFRPALFMWANHAAKLTERSGQCAEARNLASTAVAKAIGGAHVSGKVPNLRLLAETQRETLVRFLVSHWLLAVVAWANEKRE